MTRIINIIFPGLLGVLCPTGMSCLPGFQPRFEHLHELWDLKEEFVWTCFSWYQLLLDANKGNRTPSAKSHCTTDPQQGQSHEPVSSNPLHARVCLYIHLLLLPETTALGNASATSSWLHSALLSWKSLTDDQNCCWLLTALPSSRAECCCSNFLAHGYAQGQHPKKWVAGAFPALLPIICLPRAG